MAHLARLAVPCASAVWFPLEAAAQTAVSSSAIYIGGVCVWNPELSCQGLRKECMAADAVHMDLLQLYLMFTLTMKRISLELTHIS